MVEDAHAQRRDVEIGMTGDVRVEVLRGVRPGEAVIPASAPVAPGERVRVAAERALMWVDWFLALRILRDARMQTC
jgi:hypothetical protein